MTTFDTPLAASASTESEHRYGLSSILIIVLRLAMGWIFLVSGLSKVLDPEWSAMGYLSFGIPESNPFLSLWASMAGNPLIDMLNAWGALLVGISLLLGVLVRWSAFWGIVMLLFYWASTRTGGLAAGFPDEFGILIDQHIVFALVLLLLIATHAGRMWGLDGRVAEMVPQLRLFT